MSVFKTFRKLLKIAYNYNNHAALNSCMITLVRILLDFHTVEPVDGPVFYDVLGVTFIRPGKDSFCNLYCSNFQLYITFSFCL